MENELKETNSFSALFEQYKEPFILFANSYLHERVVAEDIFIEAMMQYWEKRQELSPDTNIPAYILTIIKNKALNHLRHLDVKLEVEAEIFDHQTKELKFRISSLESCDPSELFSEEMQSIIRKTMDELNEQTRRIFYKSRYENKTNREIAEELGISIKTVELHISKALKLFRARLKDYLPLIVLLLNHPISH
ncbi:MAG: RNA polymerase sigma-70 factor [Parabacteroides sp.]|jgi:RNA polymerase sigma-70 factor, Bacteroides expansion family 1